MPVYSGIFPTSSVVGSARGAASLITKDSDSGASAAAEGQGGAGAVFGQEQRSADEATAAGAGGTSSGAVQDPQVAAAVAQLKATDRAVRAHEAAHIAAGGSYVSGAASYTYQVGPDGQRYAVGGEVSIDTSPEATPAATIRKMETVRAAALAPADPSATDRAVAASAAQVAAQARAEQLSAESDTNGRAVAGASAEASPESASPRTEAESATVQSAPGGLGSLVRATYAAANTPWAEPAFRVAA